MFQLIDDEDVVVDGVIVAVVAGANGLLQVLLGCIVVVLGQPLLAGCCMGDGTIAG